MKILAIDPSGSGTTGICEIFDDENFNFFSFKSKKWEEHFVFILEFIKKNKPDVVVYETTNYIRNTIQSALSLLKLIGAIASLKYYCDFTNRVESIAVNQVKSKKKQIISSRINY